MSSRNSGSRGHGGSRNEKQQVRFVTFHRPPVDGHQPPGTIFVDLAAVQAIEHVCPPDAVSTYVRLYLDGGSEIAFPVPAAQPEATEATDARTSEEAAATPAARTPAEQATDYMAGLVMTWANARAGARR